MTAGNELGSHYDGGNGDDNQEEGEKFLPRGFLNLLLDNVGAFLGHEPDVAEGLDHHHGVHLSTLSQREW